MRAPTAPVYAFVWLAWLAVFGAAALTGTAVADEPSRSTGTTGASEAAGEWRALPPVPALHLRFEDAGGTAPCAALPENPDPAAVACWAAYVDRAVSQRSEPLAGETSLACVESWEIVPPGGACPAEGAGCVRPALGLFERPPADFPVDANVAAVWSLSQEMAREYTAFQMLRSGHALNPHRPRIAALALAQGMRVLDRAHSIHVLSRTLQSEGCGRGHLEPYFALAARVTDELGRSDVPAILEGYPPPGREWARRFHRIQLAVLGAPGGVRPGGAWQEDCEKAVELGPAVGRLDADVNVWCGYAYEQLDMPGVASLHWQLARRSPHHPEAASFASRRLAIEPVADGETTAEWSR